MEDMNKTPTTGPYKNIEKINSQIYKLETRDLIQEFIESLSGVQHKKIDPDTGEYVYYVLYRDKLTGKLLIMPLNDNIDTNRYERMARINNLCISVIKNTLEMFVNKSTIRSNFSDSDVDQKVSFLEIDLAISFIKKKDEYGFESDVDYRNIITGIVEFVDSSLKRAVEDKEREHEDKTTLTHETITRNESEQKKKPLGFLGV